MFTNLKKISLNKITALVVAAFVGMSFVAAPCALASHRTSVSQHDERRDPPPREHHHNDRDNHDRSDYDRDHDRDRHESSDSKNKYSAGDRNTAAVAGAVVGYLVGRYTK